MMRRLTAVLLEGLVLMGAGLLIPASNGCLSRAPVYRGEGDPAALLIINESDLFCPLCLQAVADLCDSVNAWHFSLSGVILSHSSLWRSDSNHVSSMPVRWMQLRRWLMRLGFTGRMSPDSTDQWCFIADSGTRLLVLDGEQGASAWLLPLSPVQFRQLKKGRLRERL